MAATKVHYSPAQNVTAKAAGALSAGTFVSIAADVDGRNPVVKTSVVGDLAFGVPAHDVADAGHVMVYRAGHIVTVQASGTIAAGDQVAVAAGGKAAKLGLDGVPVGVAVSAAVDGVVQVALN